MNFNKIEDYLAGTSFSSGLVIDIASKAKKIQYRIPYLKSLALNKRIIHIGCCDHIELFDTKINNNSWLHGILMNSSKMCIGVDINKEGIEFLKKKGINDIYLIDIEKDTLPEVISKNHWDYLILGEILEHVDNPVQFLHSINSKFNGMVEQFVITVPNTYSFNNIISLFKRNEIINTDHRYWFTPYTLAKVCYQAGFKIVYFDFLRKDKINSRFPFKTRFYKYYPHLLDTIVMILNINYK